MSKVYIDNGVSISDLNDEQLKVFKEGLFKSKGQSNNKFGVELALAGASSDEVASLASKVDGRAMLTTPSRSSTKNKAYKSVMQVVRRVPNFWDTIRGRNIKENHSEILAKMGINTERYLPVTKFDAKLSEMYLQTTFRVCGESYCMFSEQSDLRSDSIVAGKIKVAEVFSPLSKVKFAGDDVITEMASQTVRAEIELPDYEKNRAYDIDSLAHMDEAITSAMRPRELMVDLLREAYNGYFRHNPKSTYSIKIMCIMEGFYEVCREMGIAGVLDGAVNGRYYVSGATLKGVMQTVIKMAGTYRRLVKNGFSESVARETVLAEINDNIIKRASRPQLRFYPRNDYKDTPAEEREKAKKVSKPRTSSPTRRVLTLADL